MLKNLFISFRGGRKKLKEPPQSPDGGLTDTPENLRPPPKNLSLMFNENSLPKSSPHPLVGGGEGAPKNARTKRLTK